MDVWLIYRITLSHLDKKTEKFEPIEYCDTEEDARKYQKLFDLQVPADLKDRISHRHIMCGRSLQ